MFYIDVSTLTREKANELIERGERFGLYSGSKTTLLSVSDDDEDGDASWNDRDVASDALQSACCRKGDL